MWRYLWLDVREAFWWTLSVMLAIAAAVVLFALAVMCDESRREA